MGEGGRIKKSRKNYKYPRKVNQKDKKSMAYLAQLRFLDIRCTWSFDLRFKKKENKKKVRQALSKSEKIGCEFKWKPQSKNKFTARVLKISLEGHQTVAFYLRNAEKLLIWRVSEGSLPRRLSNQRKMPCKRMSNQGVTG